MQTRRLLDRATARNPLPEGTLAVGLGLVISGIATYGFLSITKRALGEDAFAPVSLLWFLTFILAPGFFLPVEQEVGRALAHRRALGQGSRPVVQRAAILEAILLVTITIVMLAVSPLLVAHLFDGSWALFASLLIAFWCYALAHLTRGVWSGTGRFHAYGWLMGSEGVSRMVLAIVLAVAGVTAVGPYGVLVGLPALFGVALSRRGQHHVLTPGPDGAVERAHAQPRLAAGRFGLRRRPAQRRAHRRQPAQDVRRPERTGEPALDRRHHRPGPAVPVPGRAGRPPAQAGPAWPPVGRSTTSYAASASCSCWC